MRQPSRHLPSIASLSRHRLRRILGLPHVRQELPEFLPSSQLQTRTIDLGVDVSALGICYASTNAKLDLQQGSGGSYAGLDRFGRVKDHRWDDTGSSADFARVKYGYDFASNRTWREDVVAAANSKDHDEFYAYDELHRLKAFDRGNFTGTAPNYTGIAGTPSRGEDFVLDQMGNWTTYQVSTSGSLTLNQTRGHNSAGRSQHGDHEVDSLPFEVLPRSI